MKHDDAEGGATPQRAEGESIQTDRFPRESRPRRSRDEVLEHLEHVVKRLRAQTLEMEQLIAEARSQVRQHCPQPE